MFGLTGNLTTGVSVVRRTTGGSDVCLKNILMSLFVQKRFKIVKITYIDKKGTKMHLRVRHQRVVASGFKCLSKI